MVPNDTWRSMVNGHGPVETFVYWGTYQPRYKVPITMGEMEKKTKVKQTLAENPFHA